MSKDFKVYDKTRQTENFGKKARVLGLSVEEQADMLNAVYKGEVTFHKVKYKIDDKSQRRFTLDEDDDEFTSAQVVEGIQIIDYAPNIISIQLPECDNLYMEDLIHLEKLFSRKNNLVTIKMPQCLDKLVVTGSRWQHYIKRIFVYDTTEVEIDTESRELNTSRLQFIGVLSTTGGKNKVIKLSQYNTV